MSAAIGVPVATVWSGPDAARARDALAVADEPDMAGWTATLDLDGRLGLHGRTVTQALLGEPADVLEERDGWAEVVLPWQPSSVDARGYRGWVRRTHLTDPAAADDTPRGVVTVPETPTTGDSRVLSYGTVLPVVGRAAGTVRLRAPGGAILGVADDAVTRCDDLRAGPAALLGSARQFLGLRYLWGGTCGQGMDCSGFVHLAHRAVGVTVPRDAFDQADACARREVASAGPGDLYFFARPGERVYHVGFATTRQRAAAPGDRTMLHAPEGDERIEDAPLPPHREDTLVSAGTFLR